MSQHSTSSQQPGSDPRPSLRARLLALVVRPTAPPLWLGIVVAAVFITGETLLVRRLEQIAPENAFGALFLVGVLVISAGWGFRLAVATTLASAAVYVQFHMDTSVGFIPTHPQDALAIIIFLPVALLANVLAGQARLRAAESELRRREAEASHAEASALAEQQAALRRVATLVARGVDPSEVYPVAVAELARGLAIDNVALLALRIRRGIGAAGQPRRTWFGETVYRRTASARRRQCGGDRTEHRGGGADRLSTTARPAARPNACAGSGCARRWVRRSSLAATSGVRW